MKNTIRALLVSATFVGVSALGTEASAVQPVRQGTFTIAAERMVGFALVFPQAGDVEFGTSLLFGQNPAPLQFPRVGADYFVIDGLSIGGTLGISYYSGSDTVTYGILPRIGYAFALSDSIDFWPRGGIGVIGADSGGFGGSTSSALLTLEGMFVWNVVEHVGIEFGPTFDAALASGGTTELGGNAGLLARF